LAEAKTTKEESLDKKLAGEECPLTLVSQISTESEIKED